MRPADTVVLGSHNVHEAPASNFFFVNTQGLTRWLLSEQQRASLTCPRPPETAGGWTDHDLTAFHLPNNSANKKTSHRNPPSCPPILHVTSTTDVAQGINVHADTSDRQVFLLSTRMDRQQPPAGIKQPTAGRFFQP